MFKVKHTFTRRVAKIDVGSRMLPAARHEALLAVGVRLLSWGWLDYRDKSRGGSDQTGYQWKPLSQRTINARWRRQFKSGWRDKVAAIRIRESKAAPKTATGKLRPSKLAVAIGIDTGRLINSLDFKAKSPFRLLTVATQSVTVGSVIKYAGHFDEQRKIFPPGFLTLDRKKQVQLVFNRSYDKAVKIAIAGGV